MIKTKRKRAKTTTNYKNYNAGYYVDLNIYKHENKIYFSVIFLAAIIMFLLSLL